MTQIGGLINSVLIFFLVAVFIRSILTWFPISRNNPLQIVVIQATEPILGPLRRYLPKFGAMDLSPMVAIILIIWVIQPIVAAIFQ